MKFTRIVSIVLLTFGIVTLGWASNVETIEEEIQAGRRIFKAEHKEIVSREMQFTPEEGQMFWPLYETYRAEMDKQGDALLKLIEEYAQLYPDVPDAQAEVMLKELASLEKQRAMTRISAREKIARSCRPPKHFGLLKSKSG